MRTAGCALIRANLHVDIGRIETEEEWARLYCEALWLERWRNLSRRCSVTARVRAKAVQEYYPGDSLFP